MKTYIMLVLLLHNPMEGTPYTTQLQQSPMVEYMTLKECDLAGQQKRTDMLNSSLSYPELAIVDVITACVDSSEAEFDPNDTTI